MGRSTRDGPSVPEGLAPRHLTGGYVSASGQSPLLPEILRRLVATVPVMGVVAIAVFALLHVTPGDPAVIIAGDYATSDDIARIRARLGLDQPFHTQVGLWVSRMCGATWAPRSSPGCPSPR